MLLSLWSQLLLSWILDGYYLEKGLRCMWWELEPAGNKQHRFTGTSTQSFSGDANGTDR